MVGEFGWDEQKRASNLLKHQLDFEDAIYIWLSPILERPDGRRDYGEQRLRAYGVVDGEVIAVVWTPRGNVKRIISARKANRHERRAYHAALTRPEPETG